MLKYKDLNHSAVLVFHSVAGITIYSHDVLLFQFGTSLLFHVCWRRNETPTLQSGLNLYIFNTCFLQLLYFISLAQQPTGQAVKHYDSETIQCAGAGRDNLYLDLFTEAKTLFWGTSLST